MKQPKSAAIWLAITSASLFAQDRVVDASRITASEIPETAYHPPAVRDTPPPAPQVESSRAPGGVAVPPPVRNESTDLAERVEAYESLVNWLDSERAALIGQLRESEKNGEVPDIDQRAEQLRAIARSLAAERAGIEAERAQTEVPGQAEDPQTPAEEAEANPQS